MVEHPLPFGASERAAGYAYGPQLRFLQDQPDVIDAELLPVRLGDGRPAIQITREPAFTAERRSPTGETTIETGFTVPALQALGTAAALAFGVGALALAFGWSWRVPMFVFGVALAGGWFWRLGFADELRQVVETVTRTDLNGDGVIGAPQRAFTVMDPAVARQAATRAARETAEDAGRAALLAFVDRCYTVGTSEAAHGVKATGTDRERYTACRDTLMQLGVAQWRHAGRPRGGWVLTCNHEQARAIVERHVLALT